jgi:hypothetical protein
MLHQMMALNPPGTTLPVAAPAITYVLLSLAPFLRRSSLFPDATSVDFWRHHLRVHKVNATYGTTWTSPTRPYPCASPNACAGSAGLDLPVLS